MCAQFCTAAFCFMPSSTCAEIAIAAIYRCDRSCGDSEPLEGDRLTWGEESALCSATTQRCTFLSTASNTEMKGLRCSHIGRNLTAGCGKAAGMDKQLAAAKEIRDKLSAIQQRVQLSRTSSTATTHFAGGEISSRPLNNLQRGCQLPSSVSECKHDLSPTVDLFIVAR